MSFLPSQADSVSTTDARRTAAICALAAIAFGLLGVRSGLADAALPGANSASTSLDLAVGLACAVSAALAPGSWLQRSLIAAVGAAWLIGSFVPGAQLANQAILVAAFLAFPTGRPHQPFRWVLMTLCVPVGFLLIPQLGVAILFCTVALAALPVSRRDPASGAFPLAGATAVGGVLLVSWLIERLNRTAFDPGLALLSYEVVLLGIAIAFPFAMRSFLASRSRLADRLLSDERLVGLEGLAVVLRDLLGDRQLRVYRWHGPQTGYVDSVGNRAAMDGDASHWLYVNDGDQSLGAVEHPSVVFDDPATAAAVISAVKLSVVNLQLEEILQSQLSELEAAQSRLMAATDRQRGETATRLRDDVVSRLEQATSDLRAVRQTLQDADAADAAEAIDVAVAELVAACDEVIGLVAGVPSSRLEGALLGAALHAIADRGPVPVTLTLNVTADLRPETASTIYYVCSEALANAAKHARATRIDITLEESADAVLVTIADDGCGGADPLGSGLLGLADRLASDGGRFRVESPPGTGTTLVATVRR